MFLDKAVRFCAPQHNQLQPGLRRTVAWSYALVCFAICTLCAGVFTLIKVNFIWSFLATGTVAWMCTLIYMDAVWLRVSALLIGSAVWYLNDSALVSKFLAGNSGLEAAAFLALLAAMALTFHRVFCARGERAFKVQTYLKRLGGKAATLPVNQSEGPFDRVIRGHALYFWALEKASSHAKKDPATLLQYGFGPGFHWSLGVSWQVNTMIAFPLGAALLYVTKGTGNVASFAHDWGTPFLITLGIISISIVKTGRTALHQSRGEQALMRLLPGVPQGAALNTRMVGMALQLYAAPWIFALAAALTASWLFSIHMEYPMIALVSTLPSMYILMGDYARMKEFSKKNGWVEIACMCLLGLLVVLKESKTHPVPLSSAVAGVAMLSAIMLVWRWRIAIKAPVALPVGRLADSPRNCQSPQARPI